MYSFAPARCFCAIVADIEDPHAFRARHFRAKACPRLDPGWIRTRTRKTRQNKNPELRSDSIRTDYARGSNDCTPTTPTGAGGMWRRAGRPPPGSEDFKKSPRRIFSERALRFSRSCHFAGDLPDVSNHFRAVAKLHKMQRNSFDKPKLL